MPDTAPIPASTPATPTLGVLHVASECFPLAKTGGLGDVVAALPAAQRALGTDARVALPGYRAAFDRLGVTRTVARLQVRGVDYAVRLGALPDGLPVYLFDAPALFDRPGTPYADELGAEFADNAARFGGFAHAVAEFVRQGAAGFSPGVVHAHDWQAALVLPWLAENGFFPGPVPPRRVFTIHNLAYAGQFEWHWFASLGLPEHWWHPAYLEFWNTMSCMKGGILAADAITTVSPTYAREILTPAYGCGLEGVLGDRVDRLSGIVNGIDDQVWNPATDPHLVARYDANTADAGKRANRQAINAELGLADEGLPLAVFIGRLADQKGADLLVAAGAQLLDRPVQLVLLASGDPAMEDALRRWVEVAPPGREAVVLRHDERLAHRLTAAADLVLMPSRFEPCGLNQLYALRYGALPVVRRTGGLADTVVDATPATLADGTATGVHFPEATVDSLLAGLDRGLELWASPRRREALRRTGMARASGWSTSAREYLALYAGLLPAPVASPGAPATLA